MNIDGLSKGDLVEIVTLIGQSQTLRPTPVTAVNKDKSAFVCQPAPGGFLHVYRKGDGWSISAQAGTPISWKKSEEARARSN